MDKNQRKTPVVFADYRNIITGDMAAYAATLNENAIMLLSGFYESDIDVIMDSAHSYGLEYVSHKVRDNWACVKLVNKND